MGRGRFDRAVPTGKEFAHPCAFRFWTFHASGGTVRVSPARIAFRVSFADKVPTIAKLSCMRAADPALGRILRQALRMAVLGGWVGVVVGCQHLSAPPPASILDEAPPRPPPPSVVEAPKPPVSATAALKTAEPPSFLNRLRTSFRLDHHLDRPAVRRRIQAYAEHPRQSWPARERLLEYLPYVCAEVRRRNMPGELCLLPVVESGLDIRARSTAGAVGLWQFMPQTARRYGLRIDQWVDERRDLVRSTDAALDYLADLHERLGNWLLAVAAYNCGGGRVERALKAAGPGDSRHLYDLRLPKETVALADKLLAMAAAVAKAEQFGVLLPLLPTDRDELRFAVVAAEKQVDLLYLAEALEHDPTRLRERNPALKRGFTHPAGPHRLIVDAVDEDAFALAMNEQISRPALAWQRVRIVPNDTLSALARRYGTDVATLQSLNGIQGSLIRAGDELIVPALP